MSKYDAERDIDTVRVVNADDGFEIRKRKELEASERFWAETHARNEQVKKIMERRSGVDWFDSCRPDDRD